MNIIGTIIFFTFFWMFFIPFFPLSVLLLLLRFLKLDYIFRPAVQALARWWARLVLAVIGIKMDVTGIEHIPATGGVCFIGNHQGDLDILVALACIKRPFGFISKKEIIFFPFVGLWVVLLDGLFLDRKNNRKAIAAIHRGAERIKKGTSMIVFPEGHRSRGPVMGEFRPGSFKLATLSGAPIVPVTIDGTYLGWEAEKRIKKADVRVVFHPPIATAELTGDDRKALVDQVYTTIASALPG